MRVILAEDSLLLREGLIRLLEEIGHEVVAAVGDAPGLLAAVDERPADVAVIDVRMPPTFTDDGLRAAVEARAKHPQLAVLVLSQYVEESYAQDLLAGGRGGVGYLLKDRVGHVREFLDSVDRVAAGETVVDPEVVRQLLGRRRDDGPLASLTEREREVLALMAEGRTNGSIAGQLVVSEAVVRKHVGSIFAKLRLDPASDRRVSAVLAYLRDPR